MLPLHFISSLLLSLTFATSSSFAAKKNLSEVLLGCEPQLNGEMKMLGFLSDRVSVGEVFAVNGQFFVAERTFGSESSEFGVEARVLSDDLSYDSAHPLQKFLLKAGAARGELGFFHILGRMSLKIADGQDYIPDRVPKLRSAGFQFFSAPSESLKLGSVIMHPSLDGLYVLIDEGFSWGALLAKLDPRKQTYSATSKIEYLPLKRSRTGDLKIEAAIVVGSVSQLKSGEPLNLYKSWESFKKAYNRN